MTDTRLAFRGSAQIVAGILLLFVLSGGAYRAEAQSGERAGSASQDRSAVTLRFAGVLSSSAVEALIDDQPSVRLRRIHFSVGAVGGDHRVADTTASAAALRRFEEALLRRTHRGLQARFRRLPQRWAPVTLAHFATSLDFQQYGASLLLRHREQDTLRTRIETDGPLIHSATVTGPTDALGALVDTAPVAGVVMRPDRLGWLFVIDGPWDVAWVRPSSPPGYDEDRRRRIDRMIGRLEVVDDPDAVPPQTRELYHRLVTVAQETYGVMLDDGQGHDGTDRP